MPYLENLFSLQGKVALVTGATRGLGRAIAEALLRAGATVVMNGSNAERLAETVRQFQDEGLPAVEFACDLSDAAQVAQLARFVLRAQPRMDVLVALSPIPDAKAILYSSGTEATECALMLMRRHGQRIHSDKVGILSLAGNYHGRTVRQRNVAPK
jgi:NAD(P)-dependent dehydrogenase (short-subunit alcohol dehydrogenase family)